MAKKNHRPTSSKTTNQFIKLMGSKFPRSLLLQNRIVITQDAMIYKIINIIPLLILTSTAYGATIPNYAVADLVLGQPNFSTSDSFPLSATALDSPSAVVVDPVSRKVFVADEINHRVFRYSNAEALASGAAAEVVFGQPNFQASASSEPPTSKSMRSPTSLFYDQLGRLWVADQENHRVLRFDSASSVSTYPSANAVYGQPNFTINNPAVSVNGMWSPKGIWVDSSDRLWVADTDNHRVLRFDSISSKPNGAAANGVLGQTNFLSDVSGSGATGLQSPQSLAVSPSGALFVVCLSANRVMRFSNAAFLSNGAAASAVLGQTTFTTTAAGLSATRMNVPRGLTITQDDSLWLSDSLNHRVLRYDQASTKVTGSAANGVVGQPNFGTGAETIPTTQTLFAPRYSPFIDSVGSLWVPDYGNRRVLRFSLGKSPKLIAVFSQATGPNLQDQVILTGAGGTANLTLPLETSLNQLDNTTKHYVR